MEMEERDFVTFTDDDGNEFELDIVDYFEYEGEEYAVLMDLSEPCECGEEENEEDAHDVYIMKIVTEGDEENFVPADEDKFEMLSAIVEERLNSECGCCGCGEDGCCEDDEDDCAEGSCGCGCDCGEKKE